MIRNDVRGEVGHLRREKFTQCLTLVIAPVLPLPPKFIIHSLTQYSLLYNYSGKN